MSMSRNDESPPASPDDRPPRPGSAAPMAGTERDELATDDATSATNRTRQGVTGHNVRYVLLLGIVGVVIAFVLVYAAFFGG